MSEIWINGNSMMSLSNHVLVWCQYKEGRQYNWMDLRILGSWNNDQLPDDKFKDYK